MRPPIGGPPVKIGEALGSVFAAGNRAGLSGYRISRASIMPEISPLRPISHWRSGKPAMIIALVLKTQLLRQLHALAAMREGNVSLTGCKRADAADPRTGW